MCGMLSIFCGSSRLYVVIIIMLCGVVCSSLIVLVVFVGYLLV